MTVDEVLRRARSQLGRRIRYELGSGGITPSAPGPEGPDGACDCSGFVAWCLGVGRRIIARFPDWPYGEWLNTETIVRCALDPACAYFDRLDEPRVGALIVYPWRGRRPGHVGIVSAVSPVRVIHCSAGNYRKTGSAVAETDAALFFGRPNWIYAWAKWVDGDSVDV